MRISVGQREVKQILNTFLTKCSHGGASVRAAAAQEKMPAGAWHLVRGNWTFAAPYVALGKPELSRLAPREP
jgi:hypothetical protein